MKLCKLKKISPYQHNQQRLHTAQEVSHLEEGPDSLLPTSCVKLSVDREKFDAHDEEHCLETLSAAQKREGCLQKVNVLMAKIQR